MSARREFVALAMQEGVNMRELCRRYGISPKTGYKWKARFQTEQEGGLQEHSRRPQCSPRQTPPAMEKRVLVVRTAHPAWGGRKIAVLLQRQGLKDVPTPSTITAILRRHGRLDPAQSAKHKPWQRFEHERPNDLWQMDFKGHFPIGAARCYPLTVLDDHSRFALGLTACANERATTVESTLSGIFERYGLPERMTMDNGSPWGGDPEHPFTRLTLWLIRLGIRVSHSRPHHPQTQGKDERFHRTLKAEVLTAPFTDFTTCQRRFDQWRDEYNMIRPHEALGLKPPLSRYQPSCRPMPATLPPLDYGANMPVRKVQQGGFLHYRGRTFRVGKALLGQAVELRMTADDDVFDIFFCHQKISTIHLNQVS